ncbi:competence protein ComEA [Mesobacillus persicus]|uniref:Competence protein ComEA n=1 Tax=Mesobacillus persicus TaxID=930146 RepID=A0A1H7XC05_9BACI|nr:helix-hairpin-helix domain-containing protein [Mesobacillus persicus]SEM30569.1 competence protein ComEA [Mesobacillus persicus]
MVEWIKEHKLYLFIGVVLLLIFSYAYFTYSMPAEEELQEDWLSLDQVENDKEMVGDLESSSPVPVEPTILMVDIKGEILNPGVYEVHDGDRIINLIEKAGGLTKDADSIGVNFALKLSDEMAVYIPKKGESTEAVGGMTINAGSNSEAGGSKVNLNSATASDLETLPGIGPAKSAAILEYRETNGSFKSIEDLKSISGIGEKTYEKLSSLITVK